MNDELLKLLLSTGSIAAVGGWAVQVLLKRMARRETDAIAAKTDADATETLMGIWMSSVLAPIQAMAKEATEQAAAARGELRTLRGEVDGVHRELALVENTIRDHQPWDQAAASEIRRLGGSIGEPPPLRLPPT